MNYSKNNHEHQNTNRHFVSKAIKILISIVILLSTISATAQQGINYKALIKDGGGNVLANDLIVVQFTILQGVAETIVYQEIHTPTTDANGVIFIIIGEGTPLSGVFADIDWGGDTHALKNEINTGDGLVDMGTTAFKAVPYALSSVDNQWLKTGNDIENTNTGAVTINSNLVVGTTINLELGTSINEISIDGTLADNSDDAIPTEKAVKAYVDNSNFNNTVTKVDDLLDGKSDNDGSNNGSSLFLGVNAGAADDSSNNQNVGIGSDALKINTSGYENTATGWRAMYSNTDGRNNTATGSRSLYSNPSGFNNTANGVEALYSNFSSNNTATGYRALQDNYDGGSNVANGAFALQKNTTGSNNTAVGYTALLYNDGHENTAVGFRALFNNTSGINNTANGAFALFNNIDGRYGTAYGFEALYSNETGDFNTAIGSGALKSNLDGQSNTAIGGSALFKNIDGSANVAIGTNSLLIITSSNNNTAIGVNCLSDMTSGSNNIGIGYNAQVPSKTGSNQVTIGNSNITSLSCMGAYNGTVGGTNRDVYVDNNGKIGYMSSSARYKNNIVSMENINWIYNLRPVNYSYKNDELNLKQYGLIAEEVEMINKALISYNKDGSVETVNYSKLIAPMLKAIQEQQEIIEEQNNENNKQNKIIEELLKRVEHLELASNQ